MSVEGKKEEKISRNGERKGQFLLPMVREQNFFAWCKKYIPTLQIKTAKGVKATF